jgi:benzoylformate decarboxylase
MGRALARQPDHGGRCVTGAAVSAPGAGAAFPFREMAAMMTAADALVATLAGYGIRDLFGLPGSTEASLLDALKRDGRVRYVMALHESIAVAMADGYARVTGGPGVVSLHTSVGAMNGLSQVYNAWRDASPVVVAAGHKDRTVLTQDGFCAFADLPGLFAGCTKWTWQSLSAGAVAGDVRRALNVAASPTRGPVFLAVPEDMLGEMVEGPASDVAGVAVAEPVPATGAAAAAGPVAHDMRGCAGRRPDAAAVRAAARLLLQARQPVLLLGNDAAAAAVEARALAEGLSLPVVIPDVTELSTLPFWPGDPHYVGLYQEEPDVLQGCDLLVAVGCRVFFPFSGERSPRMPPGARLIHVHPDSRRIGWQVTPAVGMAADAGAALSDLADAVAALGGLDPDRREERRARLANLRRAMEERLCAEREARWRAEPLSLARVAAEVGRVAPPGAVIVDEAVRSSGVVLRHLGRPSGAAWYHTSGGALGWGVPAAIGMRLAAPARAVVALVGDGAFHFSAQALWTAARHAAAVTAVVLDNGGYLAVRRAIERHVRTEIAGTDYPGVAITALDHCAVARGYGAGATRVAHPDQLGPALEAAIASDRPEVIVVPVEDA